MVKTSQLLGMINGRRAADPLPTAERLQTELDETKRDLAAALAKVEHLEIENTKFRKSLTRHPEDD